MNFPPAHPPADADARLDAAFGARPCAAPADFPARTLARVRAEAGRIAALRAGEERALDGLLGAHSIVPPADFVLRTLARIRAESELRVAAAAGQPDAVDALLDRWLADQPIETDAAPDFAASQARREAARARPPAAEPPPPLWRRLVEFPSWVRPAAGLAAAMAVAFLVLRDHPPAAPSDAGADWAPPQLAGKLPAPEAPVSTYASDLPAHADVELDFALLPETAALLEVEDFDTLAAMAANWSEEAY